MKIAHTFLFILFIKIGFCQCDPESGNIIYHELYKHVYQGNIGEYPIKMIISEERHLLDAISTYWGEYYYTRVGVPIELNFRQKSSFEMDWSGGSMNPSPDVINHGLDIYNGYTRIDEKNSQQQLTGIFYIWDFINTIQKRSDMIGKWYSPDGKRMYSVQLRHISSICVKGY